MKKIKMESLKLDYMLTDTLNIDNPRLPPTFELKNGDYTLVTEKYTKGRRQFTGRIC